MTKWLIVILAVAIITWWATRPRPPADDRSRRQNIKMTQCPKCGVYVEEDQKCPCQK